MERDRLCISLSIHTILLLRLSVFARRERTNEPFKSYVLEVVCMFEKKKVARTLLLHLLPILKAWRSPPAEAKGSGAKEFQ